jgi:ABC-type transporter MlaC component
MYTMEESVLYVNVRANMWSNFFDPLNINYTLHKMNKTGHIRIADFGQERPFA